MPRWMCCVENSLASRVVALVEMVILVVVGTSLAFNLQLDMLAFAEWPQGFDVASGSAFFASFLIAAIATAVLINGLFSVRLD